MLIGVLDFINLMVTVIVSCKREFVVIQSVSMTRKQFNRMIVNECLFYAVLTLGASYLIRSLTVGIMVRVIKSRFAIFRFTPLISHLCFRNLGKRGILANGMILIS